MKIYVTVLTVLMALKVIYMIIKFGANEYPVSRSLNRDDAAWILVFRLGLFIWGLVLLMRLP